MSVWKRKKRELERLRELRKKRFRRLVGTWTIVQGEDIVQYGIDLIEELTAMIIADVEATKNG